VFVLFKRERASESERVYERGTEGGREGGGGEPRAKRVGRRRGQKIGRRVVCKRERERKEKADENLLCIGK
jgi:hypothetical protein